jgi:hypothetical protein
MYERLNRNAGNAVAYRINQPLSKDEMNNITNELQGMMSVVGKLRVLIDLHAFPYTDLMSFWEDLKFDLNHTRDLERFALVGGGKIEKWGTMIFGTLTFTKCRCFETSQLDEAWAWLLED